MLRRCAQLRIAFTSEAHIIESTEKCLPENLGALDKL